MGRPIYPADASRVERLEREIRLVWLGLAVVGLSTGALAFSLILS